MDSLDFLRRLRVQCLNAQSREGDVLAAFLATLLLDVDELQVLDDETSCREVARSCFDDLQFALEAVRAQI